jgi:putative flippase GtrA
MNFNEINFKHEIKRFLKFCSVGLVNTAVDYLSFFILSSVLSVNIYISQGAAFMIATLNSYLLNRRFTFKESAPLFGKKLLFFYILNIFTMLISVLSLYILCDIFFINEFIAKIPIMPITFLINFFGNRLLIFRYAK